jgi:LysR family transcriptional regulator, glycine cleavage system transcriptional activator
LPRLPLFHAEFPGVTARPELSFDYVDLNTTGFDAAVRYGAGDWAGLNSTLIFRDMIRPVCAPQLIKDQTLPLSAAEIFRLPLAGSKYCQADWASWATAAETQIPTDASLIDYESRAFIFDAALSGKAVILADIRMTAADEAAGTLVNLNKLGVERPQGIHLVSSIQRIPNPLVALSAQWMKRDSRGP